MDEPGGTHPMNPRTAIPARRAPLEDREKEGEHFTAPLGSSRNGHLRLTGGAHRVVVRADSHLRGLYRAYFENRTPTVVGVRGGIVMIRYPRSPNEDWLDRKSERPAEVELNARIPWDIEIRGGASRLLADLRGLRLGSLRLEGGASRIEAALPVPSDTVAVLILGGASNVAIRRPEGASARLRVEGGVTNLTFDDRRIGATGGELELWSRGYEDAVDRYDIAVTGGANNMSIERQRGDREGADRDQEGE
jgi:hypothetical protein